MEVARSAYYNGDDLDLESFFPVVSHYGMFEWFVYVVYVGYDVHSVDVCGVLTLYKLSASPSFVSWVLYQVSLFVSCVTNCCDEVWFVVLWSFVFG